jgi:hypothetical protein
MYVSVRFCAKLKIWLNVLPVPRKKYPRMPASAKLAFWPVRPLRPNPRVELKGNVKQVQFVPKSSEIMSYRWNARHTHTTQPLIDLAADSARATTTLTVNVGDMNEAAIAALKLEATKALRTAQIRSTRRQRAPKRNM